MLQDGSFYPELPTAGEGGSGACRARNLASFFFAALAAARTWRTRSKRGHLFGKFGSVDTGIGLRLLNGPCHNGPCHPS